MPTLNELLRQQQEYFKNVESQPQITQQNNFIPGVNDPLANVRNMMARNQNNQINLLKPPTQQQMDEQQQQRKPFYNDALNDFNNNTPQSVAERYQQQQQINRQKLLQPQQKPSIGKVVSNNLMAGLAGFNKGANQFIDMALPDVITPKPLQKVIDYYKTEGDRYANQAAETNKNLDLGGKALATVSQGVGGAVPNAALALMSGGASTATQLAPKATGLLNTISNSVQTLAKNPMFWTSFSQTTGSTYEQAKKEGANELQAQATAIINGFLNAGVEVSGGIETFNPSKKGVLNWVKTALEEGKESVIQDVIQNLTSKVVYDKNRSVFSNTDENAIVNPKRELEQFGTGAAVGGIMGGAQRGLANGVNILGNANLPKPLLNTSTEQTRPLLKKPLPLIPKVSAQEVSPIERLKAVGQVQDQSKATLPLMNENGLQGQNLGQKALLPNVQDDTLQSNPLQAFANKKRMSDLVNQPLKSKAENEELTQLIENQYGKKEQNNTINPINISSPIYKDLNIPDQLISTENTIFDVQNQVNRLKKAFEPSKEQMNVIEDIASGKYSYEDFSDKYKLDKFKPLIDEMSMLNDLKNNKSLDWHKKQVASDFDKVVDGLIENSDKWKDKKLGIQYERETLERNMNDIMPKEEANKITQTLYEPYLENEATKIREANADKAAIVKLNLSEIESEYAQKLGEGVISLNDIPPLLNKAKIEKAADTFLSIGAKYKNNGNEQLVLGGYKPFDNPKINLSQGESRIAINVLNGNMTMEQVPEGIRSKIYQFTNIAKKHGIDDINYNKKGQVTLTVDVPYFPHFDGNDTFVDKVRKTLGFNKEVTQLPGDITGKSPNFRPNKKFSPNLLKRLGSNTTYDAVQGFNRYIDSMSDVIYHTSDIRKFRRFTEKLREKYSTDNISKEIDTLKKQGVEDSDLKELYDRSATSHSQLINWLDNYTNIISGKRSYLDRSWEWLLNRNVYNLMSNATNNFAKNAVAGNISSVVNQVMQVPLLLEENPIDVVMAFSDLASGKIKREGYTDKSDFLTRRKGIDNISKSPVQKSGDALFTLSRGTENGVSQWVHRTKYLSEIRKGKSEAEALKSADKYASQVMTDRTVGALPTIFNAKNPLIRLFTTFQSESNNYLSHVLKDMPNRAKEIGGVKGYAWLASSLALVAFGNWLFNNAKEKMNGTRPAPDPIQLTIDLFDATLNRNGKTLKDGLKALEEFAGNTIPGAQLPMSLIGLDVGRVPMAGMLPNLKNGFSVQDDIISPAVSMLNPIGGYSQAKKTFQGLKAVNNSGVYDKKGQLMYPVEQNTGNTIQGALFGKSSFQTAKDYYDNNRKPLSQDQTEQFKGLPQLDKLKYYNDTMEERKQNAIKELQSKAFNTRLKNETGAFKWQGAVDALEKNYKDQYGESPGIDLSTKDRDFKYGNSTYNLSDDLLIERQKIYKDNLEKEYDGVVNRLGNPKEIVARAKFAKETATKKADSQFWNTYKNQITQYRVKK